MKSRVSIGLMVVLLSWACGASQRGDYLSTTHDGLAYSQLTYKKVLEGFAEAQIQGQISDEQMANVLRIARVYMGTHNLILTLLKEYLTLTEPTAKATLQTRITTLTLSLDKIALEFLTLIGTYGVDIG